MPKIEEIILTEEAIKQIMESISDEITIEKASEFLEEIVNNTDHIEAAKSRPVDRLLWIVRTAYLGGYAQGVDLMNSYMKSFTGEMEAD